MEKKYIDTFAHLLIVFLMTQNVENGDRNVPALIDGVSYDTKYRQNR